MLLVSVSSSLILMEMCKNSAILMLSTTPKTKFTFGMALNALRRLKRHLLLPLKAHVSVVSVENAVIIARHVLRLTYLEILVLVLVSILSPLIKSLIKLALISQILSHKTPLLKRHKMILMRHKMILLRHKMILLIAKKLFFFYPIHNLRN